MKNFWIKSKPIKIGKLYFGGVPENPIVMVGTVFDIDDKAVIDHKRGIFDKESVKKDIEVADSLASELGLGHTIDVLAESPEAMVNYLSFIFEITESPIMIDGTTAEVRLAGTRYAYEVGEIDRIIYDAISPDTPDEELYAIREYKVKTSVFYALNPSDFTPKGRIEIIKRKLFECKEKSGVSQFLIDTVVFDAPSAGLAGATFNYVKKEFGFPTGNAPLNATWMIKDTWPYSREAYIGFEISLLTFLQTMGADYLFYERPKMAPYIFPSMATINGILAYILKMTGESIKMEEDHSLYRSLKKICGK
ncbi:MAG: hypothetical protein J7L07_02595 [Candidatus Odinarchaeota archaeon]|nr:hypothetical protein [Candidatus Odinarchaeota archaeon]